MMATYVAQRKENFTGDLALNRMSQYGVSILTNQKVLSYEVFNYFGIRRLFEAESVMVSTYKVTSSHHRHRMLTRLLYLWTAVTEMREM